MKKTIEFTREEEACKDAGRVLRVFRESQAALSTATEELPFLREICRLLVEGAGYPLAWVGYPEQGRLLPVAMEGDEQAFLRAAVFTTDDSELSSSPISLAFKKAAPVCSSDLNTDPTFAPWRQAARDAGLASCLCLPLLDADHAFGVLTIFAGWAQAFSPEEQDLLAALAQTAALGVSALRTRQARHTLEHDLALQTAMLEVAGESVGVFRARLSDLRLVACNQRLARMLGYDDREAFLAAFLPAERFVDHNFRERLLGGLVNGDLQDLEVRFYRQDRGIATLLLSGRVAPGQGFFHGVASDISHLRHVEGKLRQSEDRYRALMEQHLGRSLLFAAEGHRLKQELHQEGELCAKVIAGCRDGILAFDRDHRLTRWNDAMEALSGLSRQEVLGENVFTVLPALREVRSGPQGFGTVPQPHLLDAEQPRRLSLSGPEGFFDAGFIPLSDHSGEAAGGLIIIRDLGPARQTELKRQSDADSGEDAGPVFQHSEEMHPEPGRQSRQPRRLEAIGTLARGLAHDFNTILGVMQGYTEMTLAGLPEDSPLRRKLHQVLKAGQRGKELVNQILAFSRPRQQERRPPQAGALSQFEAVAAGGAPERFPFYQGQGRILFVDDEEWLGEMWQEILQSLGFDVTIAASGIEALKVFQQQPERYDLVIADQTMAPMSGLELAQALRAIRQEVPLILCTVCTDLITPENAKDAGIHEFAMKPLSISDLTAAIQRSLPAREAGDF